MTAVKELEHELFWKEVVFLTLTAIFSFAFYFRIDKPTLYIGFTLLSVIFYAITKWEENAAKNNKSLHDYFEHTSSYFILSTVFFLGSYAFLKYTDTTFVMVLLAISVVLFSAGFMRLLFSRFEE